MSYQVLARKWRPRKFSELVGQTHVVSAITHALNNDRLHHAYLFTGTRGVGKTTIARIFSKSLNCELGQSAEPCGKCDTCLSIEQGNYVDLLEIDAASRTKVEDTRELLDNVQYKPTRGKFKVYLIDEVHMLSKHSFNALLKTLEEPPPHVKFLLATTDPQKLPITILSRCLQFNLKALSREQISQQLVHILEQESIPAESQAIDLLARAANGSMRDALSLTDQAVAQGDNQIKTAVVTDMLGLMDKQSLLKLLNAVATGNKQEAMSSLASIAEQAPDYAQVLNELGALLHQIAITQWSPEACKLETTSARAIYALAKQLPAEHVQLLYKFVLEGKKELPFSVDGKTCLEMTIIRMTDFAPQGSIQNARQTVIMPPAVQADVEAEQTDSSSLMPDQCEAPISDEQSLTHTAEPQPPVDDLSAMLQEQHELEQTKTEMFSDEPIQPNPEQGALAKTEALLALRAKLANETSPEEGGEQVKKSDIEDKIQSVEQVIQGSDASVTETIDSIADSPQPDQSHLDHTHSELTTSEQITPDQANSDPTTYEAPPWVSDIPAEHQAIEPESQVTETMEPVPVDTDSDGAKSSLPAYLDNGDKLTHAKQIDDWAKLIESTELAGLTKQIALHSIFTQQGDTVTLEMDESQLHLLNVNSKKQIQEQIQAALQQGVQVEIKMGKPADTPHLIQEDVRTMRMEHARKVVNTDAQIQAIMSAFEAKADDASIEPR